MVPCLEIISGYKVRGIGAGTYPEKGSYTSQPRIYCICKTTWTLCYVGCKYKYESDISKSFSILLLNFHSKNGFVSKSQIWLKVWWQNKGDEFLKGLPSWHTALTDWVHLLLLVTEVLRCNLSFVHSV